MIYILSIITVVYAALMIYASSVQMKKASQKDYLWLMMLGSLLLLSAVAAMLCHADFDWLLGFFGGVMTCAAAYINGKRSQNFHASHHVVRLLMSACLVVGFLLI